MEEYIDINPNNLTGESMNELEFIDLFENEYVSGDVSSRCIEEAIKLCLRYKEDNFESIVFAVKCIYDAIVAIEVIDAPRNEYDIGWIRYLIRNINFIKTHKSKYFPWDNYTLEEACKRNYDELIENLKEWGGDINDPELMEDFKPEHITDIEYYLSKFKRLYNGKSKDDFEALLNNENIWRIIK